MRPARRRFRVARTASISSRQFRGVRAALGIFTGKLYFQHDIERASCFIQTPRELRRIHGLNYGEQFRRLLCLVGLQMADQMETRAGEILHFGRFDFELLDVVLAEIAQAGLVRLANDPGRENLGDRNQSDGGPVTPATGARAFDALLHIGQPLAHAHVYWASVAFQSPSSTCAPPARGFV